MGKLMKELAKQREKVKRMMLDLYEYDIFAWDDDGWVRVDSIEASSKEEAKEKANERWHGQHEVEVMLNK